MINLPDKRNWLLIIQLGIVGLVLGKSLFFPTQKDQKSHKPIVFPAHVPLEKWQQVATNSISDRLVPQSGYFIGDNLGGQSYRYVADDRSLEIKMRYLVDTNGDLKSYVKNYTGNIAPFLHEQANIGSYAMYPYGNQVYLTACINPQGETSITSDRFRNNNLRHSINLRRIFAWLTSQNGIVDSRCLWAYLSMPLNRDSPEDVYPLLKEAWFDWHQWWSQNYPPFN